MNKHQEHHHNSHHQDHSKEQHQTDLNDAGDTAERESVMDELEKTMFERAR